MTSEFYVAVTGDDRNTGTWQAPFATLHRAQQAARETQGAVTITIREGTYYLSETLSFSPEDSGTAEAPVLYQACLGETVTLSGGARLICDWQPYQDGIMMCRINRAAIGSLTFDQLFVNGKRQIRARYPNYDDSDPKNYTGYIRAAGDLSDEFSDPMRDPNEDMSFSSGAPRGVRFDSATFSKKHWKNPDDAIIHIYQSMYWGNLQWRIKAIDEDRQIIWFGQGGQQMGAKWHEDPCRVDQNSHFFIENIFEELDSPGEWYFDEETRTLYYLPPSDVNLDSAVIEVPVLQRLVEFVGTQDNPVEYITMKGLRFAHTNATFLEPYEVPSLSDWAIHRGGTVYLQGAHHCVIRECFFDAVGGNGAFISEHNRDNLVTGCRFAESGDSAICFVGSLERTVGTQRSFPYECAATNNLIHNCGVFGKQIAGVYISRAKRIRVAHNEIYNMPRAGICIGDGTWGGHIVEFNHVHDTCRETGDHGPFNAWGRDKYWCLVQSHMPYTSGRSHDAGRVKIDAMEPVVVRNNFFEETSGWGLDLDDGASNYEIYNNLCVGVSMKLREGAYRNIYNNIWVNGANSPCFHVGNEYNHDRYVRNITVITVANQKPEDDLNFQMGHAYGEVYTLIAPPARGPWLEEIDFNCFYSDLGRFAARVQLRSEVDEFGRRTQKAQKRTYSLKEWQDLGYDVHSVFADPMFVDPENGDFRVRPESPALQLGFRNFAMDQFGLTADFPERWQD
ncbi:MAG: right-handed parallel beta-helix repeat-containing protein [Anaerolineae bacterium]